MCPLHQKESLGAAVHSGQEKPPWVAVLPWSLMRGAEWDMLIDPGNSACESLCSVGISLSGSESHKHTIPSLLCIFISYSHQTNLMRFSDYHTNTELPFPLSLTSTPACKVSPLSPADTILQTSSLPASLNYSSNMPMSLSEPLS